MIIEKEMRDMVLRIKLESQVLEGDEVSHLTMRWTSDFLKGPVKKSRQRRSRHFLVLTYASRIKLAAALLDEVF